MTLTMREEIQRELELMTSEVESKVGLKVLLAFKCIKCGQIIDDIYDAIVHSKICKIPKEYDSDRLRR